MPAVRGKAKGVSSPQDKQPACPTCKSLNVYVTTKRILVCRRCGRSHGA